MSHVHIFSSFSVYLPSKKRVNLSPSSIQLFLVNFSSTNHHNNSRNPSEELYRSPSQPTNVPWASLWHNVNNASTGHIRSHIEQLRNASSSSLSTGGYYPPRVSAFRPPTVRPSASTASVNSSTSSATYPHPPVIAEYPRGFVPQQINPNKMRFSMRVCGLIDCINMFSCMNRLTLDAFFWMKLVEIGGNWLKTAF